MKTQDRWHRLIASYQTGQISDEDFAELEDALRTSPEARQLFHRACRFDSRLRREAENSTGERKAIGPETETDKVPVPISSSKAFRMRPFLGGAAAAAALVLLSAISWSIASQPKIIATLISVEDASWESSLPTEPGSRLSKGYLKLTNGIATVQFRSGAQVTLEAPAKLILKGPMKAKLVAGAAVMDVPESAQGFVLETPGGYAVDYGTKFAVQVDMEGERSEFEVISGEISVHQRSTGKQVRLKDRETALVFGEELVTSEERLEEATIEPVPQVVRIGTQGRSMTVIRNNKPRKWTRPDMLMVRRSNSGSSFDRRAVVSFDISEIDLASVHGIGLRLNLVPSGIGFASRLPKTNRFAVYGVTNPDKLDWLSPGTWEDAPSAEDGVLVGEFEIPRSQQSGAIKIEGDALLNFVKGNAGRPISLVLVRETTHIAGEGHALVHAFASDSHPEAAGPVLEFSIEE